MAYMTIEEFSRAYNIQVSTVKKNLEKIPGVEYVDLKWRVLEGTRYFYSVRSKIQNNFDRIILILKALNNNQFIDYTMLNCSKHDFDQLITQLAESKLIVKNNSQNTYGTNSFSITRTGMEYVQYSKEKTVKLLTELLGRFIGSVTSQFISQ